MATPRTLALCLAGSLVVVACAAGSQSNAPPRTSDLPDDVAPPCTFENSGHPTARGITPRPVTIAGLSNQAPRACNDGVELVQGAHELRAHVASLGQGAGAVEAPVRFETETLLVESGGRNIYAIEGDVLVVATPYSCVGAQQACSQQYFAVPKVSRVVQALCPRPKTPCMAP